MCGVESSRDKWKAGCFITVGFRDQWSGGGLCLLWKKGVLKPVKPKTMLIKCLVSSVVHLRRSFFSSFATFRLLSFQHSYSKFSLSSVSLSSLLSSPLLTSALFHSLTAGSSCRTYYQIMTYHNLEINKKSLLAFE